MGTRKGQGDLSSYEAVFPIQEGKQKRGMRWSTIFGAFGAVVEWYDVMLYAYLSVVFARVFFPADASPQLALLATLGGFAVGFLTRPLGGIFFGWLGDRKGRKVALLLAVSMMMFPMLGTAVLPGFEQWGYWATLLLILFRMIQGFSSGGEFSGTLVFLGEGSGEGRRGRLTSVATTFCGLGILLASGVAAILTTTMSEEDLDAWGWRIAYVFGGLLIGVAILMRRKMVETTQFQELQEAGDVAKHPLRDAWRKHKKPILVVMALAGYVNLVYFIVMTYLNSFLETNVGIPHNEALILATVMAAIYAVTAYFFGWVTDKVGRKPPMFWSAVAMLVLSIPIFLLLETGDTWTIWVASLVLMVPLLFFTGAIYPALSEMLPTRERAASFSVGYNLGVTLLGSTAPFVAQALVTISGVDTAPAYYVVIASVLILPVIWTLRETAFSKLEQYEMPSSSDDVEESAD